MSGTGVLSGNFSLFIDNTTAAAFTIGALGFSYEIIAVRVDQDAAGATNNIEVRQTNNAGLQIAIGSTPASVGVFFLSLNVIRVNRQIPATIPLWINPIDARIQAIELVCIGIQGITPPTPFTGVEALTIT